MSDMRFVMIGVALVFAGFIVLGVLGGQYQAATLEANEFGTCYEYSEAAPGHTETRDYVDAGRDAAPVEVNCSFKIQNQTAFFALVVGFLGAGVVSLVKGARGDWDNRVGPEDMAGPGRRESKDSDK